MSKVGIETTQNVMLNFTLASVGDRIIAFFLDVIINIIIVIFAVYFASQLNSNGDIILILTSLFIFLYPLLFELFMNGQTPGKKVMKIRVCNLEGDAPGFFSYFMRWVFRLVDIFILGGVIAVLTIIIGEKGQRLGDILAKTTVIKINNKIKLKDTIAEEIPDDYQLVFNEVENLNDEDIEVFRRVLTKLEKIDNDVEKIMFGLKVRKKINQKLGINSKMEPNLFLKTLIRDYNYFYNKE